MNFLKVFFAILIINSFILLHLFAKEKSNIYYGVTIAKLQDKDGINRLKKEFKSQRYFITKVGKFYRFSIVNLKSFQDAKLNLKKIEKKYPKSYIQKYKLSTFTKEQQLSIDIDTDTEELNSNSILKSRKLFF